MRVEQAHWSPEGDWQRVLDGEVERPQLVFVFGDRGILQEGQACAALRERWPTARLVGCSTAGEILADEVLDQGLVATALEFERVSVETAAVEVAAAGSHDAGARLAQALARDDLAGVLVFSDGTVVNGSALVRGLLDRLGPDVPISGGLAGDADRFQETVVVCDGATASGQIVGVGLYGDGLWMSRASGGGWLTFGPRRQITRAEGNVLYEVDGQPVLPLYKRYLGEEAEHLPGSALLFPLRVRTDDDDPGVVRTVLAVDEAAQSMTFAGDVPEGCIAELMHAPFEALIDGAGAAAERASPPAGASRFALLVSCVGRKMVLGSRTVDEVAEVLSRLGPGTAQAGFYSYGEIGPQGARPCRLHNQTMTVTVLAERTAEWGPSTRRPVKQKEERAQPPAVHPTLARQVRAVERSGTAAPPYLVEQIHSTYQQMDQERRRTSRSLALASEELFAANRAMQHAMEQTERLLLNVLPRQVATALKERWEPGAAGDRPIVAEAFEAVTILFTDFKGFTRLSRDVEPTRLVGELNAIFGHFDVLCPRHRMEKIKTIGDAYMAAGGLPEANTSHAADAVGLAIDMLAFIEARRHEPGALPFEIRIGLHTGPVVAGVIGQSKFSYDLWGDTVNIASRMESSGVPGRLNVSRATRDAAGDAFRWIERGDLEVKGGGAYEMFLLDL